MRETLLMMEIRAALNSQPDVRMFRNNVGSLPGPDGKGRVVFGLAKGSADLIGILNPLGRFVAFEIKTAKGRISKEQVAWANAVRSYGGFACFVRSSQEALDALDRARQGECE